MAMPSFNTSFAARPSMNNHGRLIKFAGLLCRNLRSAANDRAGNHAIQFGAIERTNGIASQQRIRIDNKLTVGIYHYQISPFAGDDSTTASGFQCICGWGFSRTLAVR